MEQLCEVDRFGCLNGRISPGGRISYEQSSRIQNAPWAFANLRNLWRPRDIWLSIKG